MYDTFVLKNVKCPHCGDSVKEAGFQSKDLDCCLDSFRIPQLLEYAHGPSWDRINYDSTESKIFKTGKIHVYTSCWACDKWISGSVLVKDFVLYGYEIYKDKLVDSEHKLEVTPELIELLRNNQQMKIDLKWMELSFGTLLLEILNGEKITEEMALAIENYFGLFKKHPFSHFKEHGLQPQEVQKITKIVESFKKNIKK